MGTRAAMRTSCRAFTLIEMLVVVAIIAILLTIAAAAIAFANRSAQKSASVATLQTIVTALHGYANEFNGFYPDSSAVNAYGSPAVLTTGANRLAEALTGYLDGNRDGAGPQKGDNDIFGFRMTLTGKGRIYGPYMSTASNVFTGTAGGTNFYFIDPRGSPILYYRATGNSAATKVFDIASAGTSVFRSDDNSSNPKDNTAINPTAGTSGFYTLLGVTASPASNTPTPFPTNVVGHANFLLLAPGLDGTYFDDDDIVAGE